MKTKKKWYDNEKDLATKQFFNQIWFAVFIFSLIIGMKHIAYFNTWEGYVLAFWAAMMLLLQQIWQWEMINIYKKRQKK